MFKFFDYLFYRIYQWDLKNWGRKNGPQGNAMRGVMFLILMNLLSLKLAILLVIGKVEFLYSTTNIQYGIVAIISLIIGHFIFISKKRYLKIAEKFSNETILYKQRGKIYVAIYIIMTFLLPVLLGILNQSK